jgi:fructose-bisphosphate aldolase, class I
MNPEQLDKLERGDGFIAALDQSGGSTPKALQLYGIDESEYSGDAEMFDRIHEMRTRIMVSPSFDGDRVLGAILFEQTMDRQVEGRDTGEYLWNVKRIVPFLKIDKGLAPECDGVQLMKPIADLPTLLDRASVKRMLGTKMRSLVKLADASGIGRIVGQQFEIGRQVLDAGLIPILEPEVDIHSPEKAQVEKLLKERLLSSLDDLGTDQRVMFKLTLPEKDDFYAELVDHPKVLKVVALSGGYSRDEANARLARNRGVLASFSRAFTEGLAAQQSDSQFDATLDASITSIYAASTTVATS